MGGGEPETVNGVKCFLLVHFQLGLLGRLGLQLSPGQRSRVEFVARVCTVYATKVLLISVTPFDFFFFFLFNISLINATFKCFVSGLLVVIQFSGRMGKVDCAV